MIWNLIAIPFVVLFDVLFKLMSLVPFPYPQALHDAFGYMQNAIWQFSVILPIPTLVSIAMIQIAIAIWLGGMFIFGWLWKKNPTGSN